MAYRHSPERAAARFWSKVRKSDGCWEWTGARTGHGYGNVRYLKRNYGAHRLAMILSGVAVKADDVICHRCDNRLCANPAHLFVGTFADNTHDAMAKGRLARGERHGRRKLTLAEVVAIRAAEGSQGAIGRQYGISQQMVGRIRRRMNWTHEEAP